jgi:hypothetical protein
LTCEGFSPDTFAVRESPTGSPFQDTKKPPMVESSAAFGLFVVCFRLPHRSDSAMQTCRSRRVETRLVSHPRDAVTIRYSDSVSLEARHAIEAAG